MCHLSKITLLFLIFLCSCAPSSHQREPFNRLIQSDVNIFFADPLVFYNADSMHPRLDLNFEIPIENISFQKDYSNQTYYSKIIISVNIKNSNKENVLSKTYTEPSSYNYNEIKEKSKQSQFYFYNYSIDPGNYKIEVEVKDVYADVESKKSFEVTAKDFNTRDIIFSDLMMLSKVAINQDGTNEITPLINNNIFGLKELYAFFEIYNNTNSEISKEYILRFKDNEDLLLKELTLSYLLSPGKNQKFESLFIINELKKYIPSEPQFDFYLQEKEQNVFFKLEIIDKLNNELIAQKKILFFPDKSHPHKLKRQL